MVEFLGWVDLDLGSYPGWWAATVANYCPCRMVEHPKSKSTQHQSHPVVVYVIVVYVTVCNMPLQVSFAKADFAGRHEHTPVIVFGIAKIRRTRLTAVISGLKLEGEIKELQTSMQYREKIRGAFQ